MNNFKKVLFYKGVLAPCSLCNFIPYGADYKQQLLFLLSIALYITASH